MYERRLKILLALMVGVILIVLGRLVQLQVLWGDRLGDWIGGWLPGPSEPVPQPRPVPVPSDPRRGPRER